MLLSGKQRLELIDELAQLNLDFDALMSLQGQVVKHAVASRKTQLITLAGKHYYIKTHSGVGWREIFKNLFNLRLPVLGAHNEYAAMHKLKQLAIPSIEFAGFGMRGSNPATLESFVIGKALEDCISLENYCANWPQHTPSLKHKRQLIKQVAIIAINLHKNGINHRDLYICHFLLSKASLQTTSPLLYLIDLHRVQIRKSTPKHWMIKDLAALHFSSMAIGLTEQDRLRFICIYTQQQPQLRQQQFWQSVNKKAHTLYQKQLAKNQ